MDQLSETNEPLIGLMPEDDNLEYYDDRIKQDHMSSQHSTLKGPKEQNVLAPLQLKSENEMLR